MFLYYKAHSHKKPSKTSFDYNDVLLLRLYFLFDVIKKKLREHYPLINSHYNFYLAEKNN